MFYIFKTVYVAVYSNISRYTVHQTVQLFIRSKNGIWKTHTTTTIILLCSLKPCRISLLPDPMVSLALLWFAEYSVTLVVLETVAFCRWGSLAVTQCNWLHSVVIKEQIVQFCIECRNCCSASAGLFFIQLKIFVRLLQISPLLVAFHRRKVLSQFLRYFLPNGLLCLCFAFQES